MASITKETLIEARPETVWAALRDFGAVHERLVPGFVVDCRVDEDGSRTVTFFNGGVAREVLVGLDDEAQRLAYSVVEGPIGSTHHNAAAQVFPHGDGASRFVWTTDVLPDEAAAVVDPLMTHGIAVIKQTLESSESPLTG